jgi:hypothetical protein
MKIVLLRAHMAQPAEAVEPHCERPGWQAESEGRFAVRLEHPTGQWKTAVDDLFRHMRIDRPEIRRRHDQSFRDIDCMPEQP